MNSFYKLIHLFFFTADSKDLDQYADLFLEQQINGRRLILMTSEDLKDIGVSTVGHRIHLMVC